MVLDDVSMLIVMAWVNTRSFSCPHNNAVAEIISEITLLFSCPCFFKKCFILQIYFALTFHLKMQVHECNNTLLKNILPHCVPFMIHETNMHWFLGNKMLFKLPWGIDKKQDRNRWLMNLLLFCPQRLSGSGRCSLDFGPILVQKSKIVTWQFGLLKIKRTNLEFSEVLLQKFDQHQELSFKSVFYLKMLDI